ARPAPLENETVLNSRKSSSGQHLCTFLPHEMLECYSRILGRKLWRRYLGARYRRTRIRSVFPCRTTCCRAYSTPHWGTVLRCQHCVRRRGPVEPSTYHLLALLLETQRQRGSCRGLPSKETR